MKRFFITIWATLCSLMCMGWAPNFNEYALVNNIVYGFDLGAYTACVLNFCTTGEVTIPSHVYYQGDVFKVDGIGYRDVHGISTDKFGFPVEYNKYRSQINKITIPQTVKHIYRLAFIGMNRMDIILIPASVETIEEDIFGYSPEAARLQTIFFMGTPMFLPTSESLFFKQDSIYPNMIDYEEKMIKHINVPKQTEVYFADGMEEKWEYIDLYRQYKMTLLQYIQNANEELRKDRYYIAASPHYLEDDTIKFKPIPPYNPSNLEYDKNGYISAIMDMERKKIIQNVPSVVNQLLEEKKKQLKIQLSSSYPELFFQVYRDENPQSVIILDSIKNEYRNYSEIDLYKKIIIPYLIMEGKPLPKSYRTTEYERYGHLYNSKEEFDKLYNLGDATYQKDKQDRQQVASVYMPRISYFFSTDNGQYTKFKKGRYADKTTEVYQIIQYIDASKKYKNEECMQYLMQNIPFSKEYAKKGRYFADINDFYEAYVGNNYNKVLRERKSKYNNK